MSTTFPLLLHYAFYFIFLLLVFRYCSYGSPGVIGQQPDIKPGQTFQYYSGVGLNDDGSMEGSFQVKLRSSSQVVDVPFGPVCFMASPTAEKMQKLLNADKDSYSLRKLM